MLQRIMALFFVFAVAALGLAQQQFRLSGVVRDLNTHREISGVNIFIKGTTQGTVSDFAGRYDLLISAAEKNAVVVFKHIAYVPREIALDSVATMRYVSLQPRVISLGNIIVESENLNRLEIAKDLPQTVSVVEAKSFEIRGYVDAGDLLRTDHSVQVEEELSGKKTVTIRGGNSDEVVVLYNGVKLNSTFDNEFDLSLIDLEDIERFEVIKGSNTALYGAEAFSGVINIVPKVQHDYRIRFQQRLGTYRSGNWGIHVDPSQLLWDSGRWYGSYSFKRGATRRNFVDDPDDDEGLTNTALHHIGYLGYNFSGAADGPKNTLGAMYINSALAYDNRRYDETLDNLSRLFSLKYTGDIGKLKALSLAASLRKLQEKQILNSADGFLNRDIDDQTFYLNTEKSFRLKQFDLLFAHQFQQSALDYIYERAGFVEDIGGLKSAEFEQQHHGLVSIAKLHSETNVTSPQVFDLGLSLRYDLVRNKQFNPVLRDPSGLEQSGLFRRNDWREFVFNFSLHFAGVRNEVAYHTFIKVGNNAKFPTLFQQISAPDSLAAARTLPNLNPEKNNSLEIGFTLTRQLHDHPSIYGWEVSGNFFQNHYDNKFRSAVVPGAPVVFYDNVPDARISGFEAKSSVFFLRKKITLEMGWSRYYISEKAAFPFKSDHKRTLSLILDHAGYSLQTFWFKEGEQVGLVREFKTQPNGDIRTVRFAEITLPGQTNLDLHLSKTFELAKAKLFLNASGRNLLNKDNIVLQGLALRDRRYYITIGAQY